MKNFIMRLEVLKDLVVFFWQQRNWWLIPFVIVLIIVGIMIVFAQSSVIAPFVYTIF